MDIIVSHQPSEGGASARGTTLVMGNWGASGVATEVAGLHVHHQDDEAWHVLSGALRFRLADGEVVAEAGSTVIVPAGLPHTFGNAGPEPSRYLIILSSRLDALIAELHGPDVQPSDRPAIYRKYASELLE